MQYTNNRVNIRGGRELRRYILEAPGQPEVLARRFVKHFGVSAFKSRLPRRTGRLRQRTRVVQRGADVQLRGVFYARLVRFNRTNIPKEFVREARAVNRRLGAIRP